MSAFREFNALKDYPQGGPRVVGTRSIEHRIMASYRGRQFFDGERDCGYGGLKYDGRWESVAASMIEDYRLRECGRQPKILQVQCEYGFLLYEFRKQGCVAVGAADDDHLALLQPHQHGFGGKWNVCPLLHLNDWPRSFKSCE